LRQATRAIRVAWAGTISAFAAGPVILLGGAGADQFYWYDADESGVGAGNRDIVMDFKVGLDSIHLAAFNITAAELTLTSINRGAGTILGVDFDHDGHNEFEVQLNNVAFGSLHAADIVL